MVPKQLQYHKGQVLVLGLLIIGVIILAFLGMNRNGRIIGEKTRQSHVVDAAAYSGALIQARALNMQAYINIAHVGHQMAMAHLVTLGAWAKWASTEATSLSSMNPPGWVIAMHFGARHGNAYKDASRAYVLSPIADRQNRLNQQFLQHDTIVKKILARASYSIRDSLDEVRNQAIKKIIQSNYPDRTDIYWSIQGGLTNALSRVFKPRAAYRSLLTDVSKVYRFLDERNHTKKSFLPVSARCPHLRHEIRRRGHTILNEQGNWQSLDTQSYHALRSNKWIGCYYREYPMGWGWIPSQSDTVPAYIEYTEEPPDNFSKKDFWRWVGSATNWNIFDGNSNPLANSKAISRRQQWSGGGMVPYIDILNDQHQNTLEFKIILHQDHIQGHRLTTQSAAQTFFERPTKRRDENTETANLWHPYWQARLIHTEHAMFNEHLPSNLFSLKQNSGSTVVNQYRNNHFYKKEEAVHEK